MLRWECSFDVLAEGDLYILDQNKTTGDVAEEVRRIIIGQDADGKDDPVSAEQ